MAQIQVDLGGPFTGHVSSIKRFLAPDGASTGASTNYLFDPVEGAFFRRQGSTILRDSYASSHETNGLLESAWGAIDRRAFPIDSPSLTDGYPTYGVLYAKDTNPSFPTTDTGWMGTVYLANTNKSGASGNYNLLREFSSNHYLVNGANGATCDIVCIPLWYESGEGGYTRGSFEFSRRFLGAGSRAALQASDSLFLPNLRGTPLQWFEKRFNDDTTAGTAEKVRIRPTGPLPLVGRITITTPAAVGAGSPGGPWQDGDTFYLEVVPVYRDGSVGAPMRSRGINTDLTSGLHLFTVGTIGGGNTYRSVTYGDIPQGTADVVERRLYRSNKQHRTAAGDTLTISPGGDSSNPMKYLGSLFDPAQTAFVDSNGNDLAPVADTTSYRNDLMMPRRARYIGTGDQRAIIGYTLPSQCAIYIVPTADAAAGDLNVQDTNANMFGTHIRLVRITASALELCAYVGGVLNTKSITIGPTISLQSVCDQINATLVADASKQWAAQLAPGVNGSLGSDRLCPTTQDITNCAGTSGNSFITTTSSFAAIPVGAMITGSGSIPASTYVLSKTATRVNLCDGNGAAVTLTGNIAAGTTLTFSADCGDGTGYDATKRGYIRCFGTSYGFMAYLKRSALPGYDRPDKQSIYFTVSSPGAASVGISLAPNMYAIGNRRQAPAYLGACMGIVDIESAAIVGYARGVKAFINQRGVNTGEDFDYRLFTVNEHRGVLDEKAFVGANGWAAYPTMEGWVAVDKNRKEMKFSNAIFNQASGTGDIAYELTQCRLAARGDTDSGRMYAATMGTRLYIAYRNGGSAGTYPNRNQVYDFGPGTDAGGLEQLVQPESRQEFGWSTPITLRTSSMCEVETASGSIRVGAIQSNAGTADGRVDQIEIGANDNGASYSVRLYLKTITPPTQSKYRLIAMEAMHYTPADTVNIIVFRDKARSTGYFRQLLSITDEWVQQVMESTLDMRTDADCIEITVSDSSGTDGGKIWRVSAVLDTSRLAAA